MDKLFELETNHDFELGLNKIIHNLSYSSSKLDNNLIALENSELKAAADDIRKLIFNSNFDMNKVGETIADKKNWNKERIIFFVNLLNKEKTNILYASLSHHISSYGETVIQSDWLLKLVLGTSELNTIKYPLLQLILSTIDGHSMRSKKMYELNKDMLFKTIKMLEKHIES